MVDWQTIVKWDDTQICGFFGKEYRWLSNFHPCPVWFEGLKYPCSENAYMAAKTTDLEVRKKFTTLSAYEAKKLGQTVKLRPDWDNVKNDYMLRIIFEKFAANPELKTQLLDTGDKYLEETNWWRDTHWGVDIKLGGQNYLGKILTKVRIALK